MTTNPKLPTKTMKYNKVSVSLETSSKQETDMKLTSRQDETDMKLTSRPHETDMKLTTKNKGSRHDWPRTHKLQTKTMKKKQKRAFR